MIAFVDTSAFYAVLDRDDENHHAARKIWQALLQGDAILVTNNYVFLETCALVQHRLGLDALRAFQQQIVPLLTIEWITKVQHESAMAAVLAAGRKRLSLVDCASFAVMREAGVTKAFAFDRHFAEQGFECRF